MTQVRELCDLSPASLEYRPLVDLFRLKLLHSSEFSANCQPCQTNKRTYWSHQQTVRLVKQISLPLLLCPLLARLHFYRCHTRVWTRHNPITSSTGCALEVFRELHWKPTLQVGAPEQLKAHHFKPLPAISPNNVAQWRVCNWRCVKIDSRLMNSWYLMRLVIFGQFQSIPF